MTEVETAGVVIARRNDEAIYSTPPTKKVNSKFELSTITAQKYLLTLGNA